MSMEAGLGFNVVGINHIGIAPKDPTACERFFRIMGIQSLGAETVPSQKTHTIMYNPGCSTTRLEILAPSPADEGPIAQFLEKRGSGIHHLAIQVDDVQKAIDHLIANNIEMIDRSPREGVHNTRIAFVHPRATGGVLIELVQES